MNTEKTEVRLTEEKSAGIDFSKKDGGKEGIPFQKAKLLSKRLKLFLWGDTGVGKSVTSLQFPKPVVIDLEGGMDLYGEAFDFDVLRANTADEVMAAVDWLLTNKHSYRTLVVDPVTVYWDSLQKKWSDIFLRRNKGSKGYRYEYYDLQVKDWLSIKAEFKELIRKLIALNMNVIITAREKTKYREGSFMVAIGETFDGEKSLPYMFDTIIRMYVDEKGRHMGSCIKDRSNKLPAEPFECSYPVLEKFFGKENLDRDSKPIVYADEGQKQKIRGYIEKFKLTPEQVERRLVSYGANSLDNLTRENADIIISKFESAGAVKKGKIKKEGNSDAKS